MLWILETSCLIRFAIGATRIALTVTSDRIAAFASVSMLLFPLKMNQLSLIRPFHSLRRPASSPTASLFFSFLSLYSAAP